jgi:hypothetical protein
VFAQLTAFGGIIYFVCVGTAIAAVAVPAAPHAALAMNDLSKRVRIDYLVIVLIEIRGAGVLPFELHMQQSVRQFRFFLREPRSQLWIQLYHVSLLHMSC